MPSNTHINARTHPCMHAYIQRHKDRDRQNTHTHARVCEQTNTHTQRWTDRQAGNQREHTHIHREGGKVKGRGRGTDRQTDRVLKIINRTAGLSLPLRAIAVFAEDLGSVPSAQVRQLIPWEEEDPPRM